MATQGNELSPFLLENKEVDGLHRLGESKGAGSYGAVYEVTFQGVPCIAKRIHGILVSQHVSQLERTAIQEQFRRECVLHSKLKHPNIVHFIGVHYGEGLSLIMEQLHTNLGDFLEPAVQRKAHDIPFSVKVSILLDVCYGLHYLHGLSPQPLVHRDLSANNILLTTNLQAKIADLGVSKLLSPSMRARAAAKHTKAPGCQNYMPPEALQENPMYDEKLDIFSFGHLTLYVAIQEFPQVFEPAITPVVLRQGTIQILKRRKALDKMGESNPLYAMTVDCLRDRPRERPTAQELMNTLKRLSMRHPMSSDHDNIIHTSSEDNTGRQQMLRMERERGDLEQRTHGLLVDNRRLEEQCDHLCRQLQEAKEPMEKVKRVLSETEQSRQEVFQQLHAAKVKVTSLEQANHDLQVGNKRLAAQNGHVAYQSFQLEEMRREIDKLKKENDELHADHDALKFQTSRDTWSVQTDHVAHITFQLEEMRRENEKLRKEKEDLHDALKMQVDAFEKLQQGEGGEATGPVAGRERKATSQFQQLFPHKKSDSRRYKTKLKAREEEYDQLLKRFDELQLLFVDHKEKYEQCEKEVETYKVQRDQAIQQAVGYKAQLAVVPYRDGITTEEFITQKDAALKAALHRSGLPYHKYTPTKAASDEPIPRGRLQDWVPHQRHYAEPNTQLPHSCKPGSRFEPLKKPPQEIVYSVPVEAAGDCTMPRPQGYYSPLHTSRSYGFEFQ